MEQYIKEKVKILKQLHIWGKISKEEKARLNACTNEIQVDNMMGMFRRKYL